MNYLSDKDIDFITKEISNSAIVSSDLKEDLIDHFCCIAEDEMRKGKKFKDNQKYQKAIDLFVKALSVNANSAEPWFELGEINLIRNRIPEALTCYERAVDIKPNYPEALEKIKEVEQILKDSGNEQDQK